MAVPAEQGVVSCVRHLASPIGDAQHSRCPCGVGCLGSSAACCACPDIDLNACGLLSGAHSLPVGRLLDDLAVAIAPGGCARPPTGDADPPG